MLLTAENRNTERKICLSGTLYTTNPTWTGLRLVVDNVAWDRFLSE
jgi:hypothetical protein